MEMTAEQTAAMTTSETARDPAMVEEMPAAAEMPHQQAAIARMLTDQDPEEDTASNTESDSKPVDAATYP